MLAQNIDRALTAIVVVVLSCALVACQNMLGCPEGAIICDRECVDPTINREHCGGCDQACSDEEDCDDGVCRLNASHCDSECSETVCLTSTTYVPCGEFDNDVCNDALEVEECEEGEECPCTSCVVSTFDDGCPGWAPWYSSYYEPGTCEGGAMTLGPLDDDYTGMTMEFPGWIHEGYQLRVRVRLAERSDLNVKVKRSSSSRHHHLEINDLGNVSVSDASVSDGDRRLASAYAPFGPLSWHTIDLRWERYGRLELYIDGELLDEAHDDSTERNINRVTVSADDAPATIDVLELCPPTYPEE